MGKIRILIIGTLCLFVAFSCDDLIVEDLADKDIVLVSPVDSTETEQTNITFLWEELEGVDSYLLQVAEPSFENATNIVLDTLLDVNSFSFDFSPGEYEWRLRGENSVSRTEYFYSKLTVQEAITEGEEGDNPSDGQ